MGNWGSNWVVKSGCRTTSAVMVWDRMHKNSSFSDHVHKRHQPWPVLHQVFLDQNSLGCTGHDTVLDLLPIIYFKGGCIVPISIRLGKSRLVRSSLLTRHAIFSCLFRNPVFCSSQIVTYSTFEVVLSIISPTSEQVFCGIRTNKIRSKWQKDFNVSNTARMLFSRASASALTFTVCHPCYIFARCSVNAFSDSHMGSLSAAHFADLQLLPGPAIFSAWLFYWHVQLIALLFRPLQWLSCFYLIASWIASWVVNCGPLP